MGHPDLDLEWSIPTHRGETAMNGAPDDERVNKQVLKASGFGCVSDYLLAILPIRGSPQVYFAAYEKFNSVASSNWWRLPGLI